MKKLISALQMFGWALASFFLLPVAAFAAPLSHEIKIDHFGYRPADTKISIFSANPGIEVEIRNATDEVVFRVPLDGGFQSIVLGHWVSSGVIRPTGKAGTARVGVSNRSKCW